MNKWDMVPRFTMLLGVIIVLLVFYGIGMTSAFLISYQNEDGKKLEQSLEKANKENKVLKEEISSLQKTIQNGQAPLEGTCDFTKTYKVIGFLTNYSASNEDDVLVIVDQYQSFNPFIMHVTKEQSNDLEIGKYYEFSFTGDKSLSLNNKTFDGFKIKQIKYTDKTGLDQIQEGCK